MTTTEILQQLTSLGVTVTLESAAAIALDFPAGQVNQTAVALARRHKQDLLTHLHGCAPHTNPSNWQTVDTPAGPQARCRQCGRFIGYVRKHHAAPR